MQDTDVFLQVKGEKTKSVLLRITILLMIEPLVKDASVQEAIIVE